MQMNTIFFKNGGSKVHVMTSSLLFPILSCTKNLLMSALLPFPLHKDQQ